MRKEWLINRVTASARHHWLQRVFATVVEYSGSTALEDVSPNPRFTIRPAQSLTRWRKLDPYKSRGAAQPFCGGRYHEGGARVQAQLVFCLPLFRRVAGNGGQLGRGQRGQLLGRTGAGKHRYGFRLRSCRRHRRRHYRYSPGQHRNGELGRSSLRLSPADCLRDCWQRARLRHHHRDQRRWNRVHHDRANRCRCARVVFGERHRPGRGGGGGGPGDERFPDLHLRLGPAELHARSRQRESDRTRAIWHRHPRAQHSGRVHHRRCFRAGELCRSAVAVCGARPSQRRPARHSGQPGHAPHRTDGGWHAVQHRHHEHRGARRNGEFLRGAGRQRFWPRRTQTPAMGRSPA